MIVRSRFRWAALLGCAFAAPAARAAEVPAPPLPLRPGALLSSAAPSTNQQMAEVLAAHLRQSGQLRNYTVDLTFQDGVVELSGTVRDQSQREEVLRLIQGVPGVERVRDRLTIGTSTPTIQPVQAVQPILPKPVPEVAPALPGAPAGPLVEPAPVFQAPPGPNAVTPPRMPPYAWPTYAPYNNYSRVALPEAYPYNAFPFIGPCYPFPKVPLGWRSVKLEWDDGYWWYSRTATKHDWWKLRYQ